MAPLSIQNGSILDIGCGPANNLFHFKRALGARRGVGIEPSSLVTETLSQAFPELEFYDSDSRALPFKSGEFDVVLLCGVLAWVDRDYFLQTLGEAIRVTSKYFILNDFAPYHPYSAVYHYEPQYRTNMNQNRSDSESASDHFVHSASFVRSMLNPRAAASLWDQTRNVTLWHELHFRSRIQSVPTFSTYGKLRSTAPRTSCDVGGGGAAGTSEARTVARKARLQNNMNDLLASITASRIRA